MLKFISLICFFLWSCSSPSSQEDVEVNEEIIDFQLDHEGDIMYYAPLKWQPGLYNTAHEINYRILGDSLWQLELAQRKTGGRLSQLVLDTVYEVFVNSFDNAFNLVSSDTLLIKTVTPLELKTIIGGDVSLGLLNESMEALPPRDTTIDRFLVTQEEIQQESVDEAFRINKLYQCDTCPANRLTWDESILLANDFSKLYALDSVYEYKIVSLSPEVLLDSVTRIEENVGFRLLDEVEWEFLADNGAINHSGPLDSNIYNVNNLIGGVWEWVYDPYDSIGGEHVLRGGSDRETSLDFLNSYHRLNQNPRQSNEYSGLRLAITPPPED